MLLQGFNVRASGELWLKHSVEACAYPIIITLSTNGSPDVITGVLSAPLPAVHTYSHPAPYFLMAV